MNFLWDPLLTPLQLGLAFGPPALALLVAAVWAGVRTRSTRGVVRALRRLLALALLFVAALGPSYGTTTTKVVLTDADVFILLDTTTSSNAEDWGLGERRLEGMKQDVVAIMEHYAGSRYTLITFDSAALTRLPLVRDPIALRSVLDPLDVELTEYAGGGDVGRAAALLERRLEESRADHPERVQLVFYLGDGEQTATIPPTSFAGAGAFVQGGGVLGYGTLAGGRMRENNDVPYLWYDQPGVDPLDPEVEPTEEPYVQDGAVDAISRIDEVNLRAIAGQLGVGYQHRLPGTDPTLPGIENLLGQEVEIADVQVAQRWYWVPAIPAFLLIAWDVLLVVGGLGELLAARKGMRA